MGKTRDLIKKTGDIKGIFHVKMGTIKDRNSKNLTEAEEIKKNWQEYTEELTMLVYAVKHREKLKLLTRPTWRVGGKRMWIGLDGH